ncbi:MAG TPA: NAD(P)/FAD-dependent oxidoreductase [Vicinamibacterales bacterium]|jgi:NADH dehydrogenase|nr:NAD(P)/FAD-dependent oxidoreductase [Vicinamibacterales bacterium]
MNVVIVGGGFAGLSAARALRSAPVNVTVVDRRNYHLFQPLLYQVATGSLSAGEVAAPLRGILGRQRNTRVLLGQMVDLDPKGKRVLLADGASLEYDALIIAVGSQTSYFGHDAWREWAPGLKSIDEAVNVRHKILYAFEVAERIPDPVQRQAWLTFVIVGAGPTGVELAGAIGEIARQTLRDEFRSIHPDEARIILLDGLPRVLMPFPEDLAQKARRSLERLGVEIQTGTMVQGVDRDGLTVEGGGHASRIEAHTVIWAGGVTMPPVAKTIAGRTQAETDKAGRIKVNADLTIPGYSDIYVTGDLASLAGADGKPLPGVAQVAMQQGAYAAKSIGRKARGEERSLPPFAYFDKGTLAVIGRGSAVANIFGLHVSGLPAWLVWAFIHVLYLVGFESRVTVFIKWALQALTFNRSARLITGAAATDFDFSQAVNGASLPDVRRAAEARR